MSDIKSNRRYVLQKSFPNAPKGTLIKWNPGYQQYMSWEYKHNHSECVFFTQEEIDRNPDWFLPEQPEVENEPEYEFVWDDFKVLEMLSEYARHYNPQNERSWPDALIKFKQSKQPLKPDSKVPIKFSKEESNFIQAIFNLTDNWYWTDFYFRRVGDCLYELWDAEKLPDYIKKVIRPKTYTQQQLDKAIQKAKKDAWNFAREKMIIDGKPTERQYRFLSFYDYENYEKTNETLYQQSLQDNSNTKTSKHWT